MRLPAIVLALFLGFLLFAKPASAEEKTGTAQHGQHPYNSLEQHPECDGIIAKLDKSGSATVSIGWWPAQRLFTSDAVEPVRQVCSLAELASYWPHRLGAIDLLAFAAPTLDDNPCLTDFDETLFGATKIARLNSGIRHRFWPTWNSSAGCRNQRCES